MKIKNTVTEVVLKMTRKQFIALQSVCAAYAPIQARNRRHRKEISVTTLIAQLPNEHDPSVPYAKFVKLK